METILFTALFLVSQFLANNFFSIEQPLHEHNQHVVNEALSVEGCMEADQEMHYLEGETR